MGRRFNNLAQLKRNIAKEDGAVIIGAEELPDSELAATFEALWQRWASDITLLKEHVFHDTRGWRIDYYHPKTKTGIEIEGGVYQRGRHNRPRGYLEDIEKYNAAQMQAGIVILRLGTGQIDDAHIEQFASYIRGRS